MSFLSDLFGKTSAKASRAAAADTYAKQQAAGNNLRAFGDTYASEFDTLANEFGDAGGSLRALIEDPTSVRALPGYEFARDEGIQALDRSAAARGQLNSGRQSKDLMRFATGTADQAYGNHFDRLLRLVTGKVGTRAQGMQGQLATNTAAYGGDMASAGTVGQGEIAAAQARQGALQNILGTVASLGGSFLGGKRF